VSYDLYFRSTSKGVSDDGFRRYFSERPNYAVEAGHAWYSNKDTGVYFCFDWSVPGDDKGDCEETYDASFNVNFLRPHPFGLEAEPEVAAFVEEFKLAAVDRQSDLMDSGAYSREAFLDSWNASNKTASEGLLSMPDNDLGTFALPAERINACWLWNFARSRLQVELTDDVFVPPIMFTLYEGRPQTFVVWPDAIPIALPTVDLFVLHRERISDRRFLLFKKASWAIATDESAEPHIGRFPMRNDPVPFRLLSYTEPPAELVHYFNSLGVVNSLPEFIPFDKILEQELVDQVRQQ